MSTTALTSSRQQTQAAQRPNALLSVLTWELRRFRASRLFGVQALRFFVLWLEREPDTFGLNTLVIFFVAGTSAWGLLESLPIGLLMLLVFLLPFVNADGVTRDLQRRIHELLMTTTLPTRAYVWERYLMGLLVSLGLAPHKYRFLRVQPTGQRSGGGSYLAPPFVCSSLLSLMLPGRIGWTHGRGDDLRPRLWHNLPQGQCLSFQQGR